jgi:hypothetical protein
MFSMVIALLDTQFVIICNPFVGKTYVILSFPPIHVAANLDLFSVGVRFALDNGATRPIALPVAA